MGNYSLSQLAIGIVICLALCALVYIAAGALGVPIPYWVVQVITVVIVAAVVIVAIKFLLSLNS